MPHSIAVGRLVSPHLSLGEGAGVRRKVFQPVLRTYLDEVKTQDARQVDRLRNVLPQKRPLAWLPQLLQTNDSIFPSGSYAHSFGLEGLVQLDLITDPDSFADFLRRQIVPALRQMELPFVRFAFDAATDHRLARLCELDECYGAMKGAFELRQASRRIGAQRLQMLLQLAPQPMVEELERERVAGRCQAYAPIVFGAQMALNKTPIEAALTACYYQTLAALVSAAMKLIRLGQSGAQALLSECLGETAAVVGRALAVRQTDAGWFQPTLDIASARHETAYTRVFIS